MCKNKTDTNKAKVWENSIKCWVVMSIIVHEGRESVLFCAVLPAPYTHTKKCSYSIDTW